MLELCLICCSETNIGLILNSSPIWFKLGFLPQPFSTCLTDLLELDLHLVKYFCVDFGFTRSNYWSISSAF